MRLPFRSETSLPVGLDDALAATEAALAGDTPHGYLRAWTKSGQRFLFFLQGKVHSAGKLEGDEFIAAGIRETVQSLRQMDRAVLHGADLALLLSLAVPFRKAPAAQVPASLVDPHMLLESIRKTETDGVLVVRRNDARTLAFCRNGEPEALFVAAGETFPEEGAIADRIVEYVFSGSAQAVTLDIYDQIRLPPAADAGQPLASYLEGSDEPELPTKTLIVRLGDRAVFQYPMTEAEIVVGRGSSADLALDNLSVSRKHAKIRREGDTVLVVEDLGGKNGLELSGKKVERALLGPGDSVGIGKYTLEYQDSAPVDEIETRRPSAHPIEAMQETIAVVPSSGLVLHYQGRDYNLRMVLTIGKTEASNVVISGWWIAPRHVQIVRDEDGVYRASHIAGRRALRVNGVKTKEAAIEIGDILQIGRNVLEVRELDE
ncbi:MAG: FHA domain-containing protein [Deltaproteobacteria bacterium]|nr:FHA domain-containing protein [Deltaproteobacteria bacterium]